MGPLTPDSETEAMFDFEDTDTSSPSLLSETRLLEIESPSDSITIWAAKLMRELFTHDELMNEK